jgi:hypothetical protein
MLNIFFIFFGGGGRGNIISFAYIFIYFFLSIWAARRGSRNMRGAKNDGNFQSLGRIPSAEEMQINQFYMRVESLATNPALKFHMTAIISCDCQEFSYAVKNDKCIYE